jgi:SAM-dependent methyltransferase
MPEDDLDYCNLEVMAEAHRYNAFLVDAVRRAAGGARRILDFGAGSGVFASELRALGYDVTCIEPEPRLRHRLADAGFDVRADLDSIPDESMEFVYTLNVLEHIPDDGRATAALARILVPGGTLFVYVPAFMILYTSMDRKVGHLRRYRAREVCALVERAGLTLMRSEYVDALGAGATLLYRWVGPKDGGINRRALRIYDTYLFTVSRLIDRVTRRIMGKNLLVVASKPKP